MAVVELLELEQAHGSKRPLAGVDLGAKTIGLALSDLSWSIASPFSLIRRSKFTKDAAELLDMLGSTGAAAIVVGLPLNMDGSHGPRVQSSEAFVRNLLRLHDVTVAFWDERLSTAAVNRMLISGVDASRARRAELVDKLAATWILQGALDRLRTAREAR